MARVGRNQPCPCGSGRKAKRCCDAALTAADRARVWLDQQARRWAPLLADLDDSELKALGHELTRLPVLDPELQAPLPRLLSPALDRAMWLAREQRDAELPAALRKAVTEIDSPVLRERLARAVLARHDDDRLACVVTAAAVVDLATSDPSVLLAAGLLQSLLVAAGEAARPSGLLVGSGAPGGTGGLLVAGN